MKVACIYSIAYHMHDYIILVDGRMDNIKVYTSFSKIFAPNSSVCLIMPKLSIWRPSTKLTPHWSQLTKTLADHNSSWVGLLNFLDNFGQGTFRLNFARFNISTHSSYSLRSSTLASLSHWNHQSLHLSPMGLFWSTAWLRQSTNMTLE